MFNADFFPTPIHVIDQILTGEKLAGKNVLEPSAGKGDIVDYCTRAGAYVSACEINDDLRQILYNKCRVLLPDFLQVTSEQISHIDLIVMNPPFSADEKHILHAWEIAPAGCKIIALCNWQTLDNPYSRHRAKLRRLAEEHGRFENIGDAFVDAERVTAVDVGLVIMQKPGGSYEQEFEGFYMDEIEEQQFNGIMPYNFVRDIVNLYVAAVKIYDEQVAVAEKMRNLLTGFYSSKMQFVSQNESGQPVTREEFKKDLQKQAWLFILKKMKMEKYTTKGLKEDLNKFTEKQYQVPFTMKNIYHMLQLIVGTHSDRMGKALIEVFDKLTQHYHENRYNVEGWKTNSHYLINQKFIMPYLANIGYSNNLTVTYSGREELIDDMNKGLCWLTGRDFDEIGTLWHFFHKQRKRYDHEPSYPDMVTITYEFNKWYDFGFFEIKGFKKGTMHFKFKDINVWGLYNQKIAQLKGYPLYEYKKAA